MPRSDRVELRPTVQDLFDMVHTVSRDMVTVIDCIPRIAEQLTSNQRAEFEVSAFIPPSISHAPPLLARGAPAVSV